jgi:TonB family protein
MAENVNRVLKIGLIQDGTLVEDKMLGNREGLTVGSDPKNALPMADKALPKKHMLIEWTAKGYKLNILPEMKGRLLIDDHFVDIARLIAKGQALKTAAGYEVPLKPDYKGKINVGDFTVLFQLVPPPPPPAAVVLPKEIKGGVFRNVDMMFLVILILSALMHTGMAVYLQTIPFTEDEVIQVATEQFVSTMKDEDIIVQQEKTPEGDAPAKKPGGGGGRGGPGKIAVENKGMLALLTRSSGQGAVADLLSSGLGNDLKNAVNGITGVKVGQAGDSGTGGTKGSGTGGPGSGTGYGIGDLGSVGTGGGTGTGDRGARKVTAKLSTGAGGVTGKIDAAKVHDYIRSHLGGVRNCYEMQLNANPTLAGKVKVLFSVDGSGSVSSCSVTDNSLGNTIVSECVCRRIGSWRFPPPEEGTVTISYTFIFQPAE